MENQEAFQRNALEDNFHFFDFLHSMGFGLERHKKTGLGPVFQKPAGQVFFQEEL